MYNSFKSQLTQKQKEQVHACSLEVLAQKGYMYHSEEACRLLCSQGAVMENGFVKIPEKLMEQYLSSCPQGFLWKGRGRSIKIGEGQDHFYTCQNHGPIFIHELDGKRRLGNLNDLITCYKLGQSNPLTGVVGQVPIDPAELAPETKEVQIAFELLKHTDKPIMSYPMSNDKAKQVFAMFKTLYGEEYLKQHYSVCASVCSLSPLQLAEDSCDTILWYAKHNQPLMFMSGVMFGITGFMNFSTALVQLNVENLAAIALAQAARPGLPVIYGCFGTVSNMFTGVSLVGDPDTNRVNKLALEMAHEFYKLPTRSISGNTDAKMPDMQAGFETMETLFDTVMSGTNLLNECLGILDSMLGISFEKYIIDEEILNRVLRMSMPLPFDENSLNADLFKNVDQYTSFLTFDDTLEGCASLFRPSVSCRDDYEIWEKNGMPSIFDKAREKLADRLASAPASLLSLQEENSLKKFLQV